MKHSFRTTTMPPADRQFFLGRQPIVDRRHELVGYELLFRQGEVDHAEVSDDVVASAAVIQHTFAELGLRSVLGDKLGFINLSEELLMSDLVEVLPREQVVLEILETVPLTPIVVQRCRQLRAAGYRLALDDVIRFDDLQRPLLPLLEVVKLDVVNMTPTAIAELVRQLKPYRVQVLAEKIDTASQRDFCLQLGCDLFQGYYFARPTILCGRPVQPATLLLLRLLAQVTADADNDELEDTLKQAPDLTVHLLKLVNSVAVGQGRKISSVGAALTLLGRAQLQRWVQIMVFARQAGGDAGSDPLVQTAAVRGRMMENLAALHAPGNESFHDRAFMVGMLSLIDALFGLPMTELLPPLNLDDSVQAALLLESGSLGHLLRLVRASEAEDQAQIIDILSRSERWSLDTLNQIQLEALAWASRLSAAQ
ncbi:EAL and HDOD domain-containing protein [Chitinimonas lacunae]|uniref:EAL and HDOD domain-containing protein n=1 Tax=Chitinimonas lacunae TaxID=1963018 RepID=A0ABV8MST5_9NEIS